MPQVQRVTIYGTTVNRTGADRGSTLHGAGRSNAGLRVRITESQPPGAWGPLHGPFVLLDAGDNVHTSALRPFVGQTMDAAQVLRVVRRAHPACVNVVNTNVLRRSDG